MAFATTAAGRILSSLLKTTPNTRGAVYIAVVAVVAVSVVAAIVGRGRRERVLIAFGACGTCCRGGLDQTVFVGHHQGHHEYILFGLFLLLRMLKRS